MQKLPNTLPVDPMSEQTANLSSPHTGRRVGLWLGRVTRCISDAGTYMKQFLWGLLPEWTPSPEGSPSQRDVKPGSKRSRQPDTELDKDTVPFKKQHKEESSAQSPGDDVTNCEQPAISKLKVADHSKNLPSSTHEEIQKVINATLIDSSACHGDESTLSAQKDNERIEKMMIKRLLRKDGITDERATELYLALKEEKDNEGQKLIENMENFKTIYKCIKPDITDQNYDIKAIIDKLKEFKSRMNEPHSLLQLSSFRLKGPIIRRKPTDTYFDYRSDKHVFLEEAPTVSSPTISRNTQTSTSINEPCHLLGLKNYGNTCFINSALQSLAGHIEATDYLKSTMIAAKFPKTLTETDSHSIPEDIYTDMQTSNTPIDKYQELHNTFMSLMALLRSSSTSQKQVDNTLKRLIGNYRHFRETCPNEIARHMFEQHPDSTQSWFHIPQEDSHEFLTDMIKLFHLNTHRGFNLLQTSTLTLRPGDSTPIRKEQESSAYQSAIISIPIPKHTQTTTLQKLVNSFLSPSEVDFKWEDADLETHGLNMTPAKEREKWVTTHTINLTCLDSLPPSRIYLQAKIFYSERSTSIKLAKIGCDLLRQMDNDITLPIQCQTQLNNVTTTVPKLQRYQIKSIICHKGKTVHSGHYVLISKVGKRLVYFNDQQVSIVGKLDANGRIDWTESTRFNQLINQGFSGYVFSLEAIPDSAATRQE